MYGADRSFARTIGALKAGFSSAHIKIILPQDGPITSLHPLDQVERKVRPMWILRRRTLLRGLTVGLWSNVCALFAAYRDMKSANIIYINTVVVFDFIVLARLFRKPVIVHVREIPNGIEMHAFRALLRWSRASVIFNSQATREAFRLPKGRASRVVYNGVATPQTWRESVANAEKTNVLMIGRLNHWKGQEILIEAVSKLDPAEKERLHVRIVGSTFNKQDDFLERLRTLVKEKALEDIVRIEPFEADPSWSFRNADLVVVPSRLPEPFGNVAVEAMAFAKPVIASSHGGLREIVVDGKTGRLFEPGNFEELSRILRDCLENPALYRRYGSAGRQRFEARFTTERSNHAFVAAIKSLIVSKNPRARSVS
jgi:glycosyltransferase involved in cell wall biosynthesis